MGDVEAKDIKMLSELLKLGKATSVTLQALEILLGLTASTEGLETLYKNAGLIFTTLVELTFHSTSEIAEKAATVLVNVSAETRGVQLLLSMDFPERSSSIPNNVCKKCSRDKLVSVVLEHVFDDNSPVVEQASMVLANLSRDEDAVRNIFNTLENESDAIERISVFALKMDTKYDYLSSLLANLSQLQEVRKILIKSTQVMLQKLFSLIGCTNCVVRRTSIVGLIRNLCLAVENHDYLLNPEIDLLPRLLLPLAGPEEFDDEDNEKLPLDLQYLPSNKTREPDEAIRKMLLDILMQLCATKSGREMMRRNTVYVILRELHKWEKNAECVVTCEDLVNLIIRTEEEIGADNLKNVQVPPDLTEKFNNME